MTPKPEMARDDAQKQLLLMLSEATTKKLVDGLADKVNESHNAMTTEIRELKIVLMGSELDKSVGVVPSLRQRIARAEKVLIGMALVILSLIVGNPKALLELGAKFLA